ncbi:DUF3127 domain-containing protein [Jiulongibacter sediminis]|jgi:hypothetical protein|uniref:DUF3127 domain-containing protein n=1 Tax=Jiulongibacter sediminis TaxID=1605367 RepID=UPI0026ED9FB2|nr:DUF3127 domain-containing protein [Jiulongibacter sediminis]
MEISGNIIQVLPLQSGEGKNGPWKKQDFVIETESQYPKKVCISMWGDRIDENMIKVGNGVTASIDVESREYNGRWYTDVKAWKLEASTAGEAGDEISAPADIPAAVEGEDDLPF